MITKNTTPIFELSPIDSLCIPYPHKCHLSHEPNKETEKYLLKPDSEKGYKSFSDLDELFADLLKE
jgi:hypothetical protein